VSFEAEHRLIRMHPRGSRLILPTLALALAVFLLTLVQTYITEQWQFITLYSVAGAIAFFFWFVPLISYLTTWTDITTARTVHRSGLFGQHFREVSHSKVSRVELAPNSRITLYVEDDEPFELKSVAKTRFVATELAKLVAK